MLTKFYNELLIAFNKTFVNFRTLINLIILNTLKELKIVYIFPIYVYSFNAINNYHISLFKLFLI